MAYSIVPVETFKKQAKRLIKKYPSLKSELAELSDVLSKNPTSGSPLGNDTFKIRLSIKSKGKGKRGGARIITYVVSPNKEVYLLTIYDKSEIASVDDGTLRRSIEGVINEG